MTTARASLAVSSSAVLGGPGRATPKLASERHVGFLVGHRGRRPAGPRHGSAGVRGPARRPGPRSVAAAGVRDLPAPPLQRLRVLRRRVPARCARRRRGGQRAAGPGQRRRGRPAGHRGGHVRPDPSRCGGRGGGDVLPEHGFPLTVRVDRYRGSIDDEFGYQVLEYHPTRPAGRWRTCPGAPRSRWIYHGARGASTGDGRGHSAGRSSVPKRRSTAAVVSSPESGNRWPPVFIVSSIDVWPNRAMITRGCSPSAIRPLASVWRSAWKPKCSGRPARARAPGCRCRRADLRHFSGECDPVTTRASRPALYRVTVVNAAADRRGERRARRGRR